MITPPPIESAEYCDERVCLYVCVSVSPRSYLRNYTSKSNLHQIFVRVTHGHGSVLLWRHSDTLCTSGFMVDVIFAHKPRLIEVAAQLKRSAHAAYKLCAVIPVAVQRTHGTTFSGAESNFQPRGRLCGLWLPCLHVEMYYVLTKDNKEIVPTAGVSFESSLHISLGMPSCSRIKDPLLDVRARAVSILQKI